jgi:hypothetical protein
LNARDGIARGPRASQGDADSTMRGGRVTWLRKRILCLPRAWVLDVLRLVLAAKLPTEPLAEPG